MRVLLLILGTALATTGCRKHGVIHAAAISPDALLEGTLITGAGTWSHFDRGISRDLTIVRRGNEIAWTDEYMPSQTGRVEGSFTLHSPADPWFVYVESAECLWIFDGIGTLQCRTICGPSVENRDVISGGKFEADGGPIPAEVFLLLPGTLQKLLPAAANSPPSI